MPSATIAVSNSTAKSFITLIRGVTGHSNDDGGCAWVTARGDDGNSANLYIGSSQVSSSNYGVLLQAGDSRTWSSGNGLNNVDLLGKFALASTTGQSINLEWEYS